jgi:SAM-dependent methyltransferase
LNTLSSLFRRGFYELLYWRGKPRWDTGITPPEVIQLVETEHFPPGRALDLGCGTGTNVIYLASRGFEVTGIDFVPRAVAQAREKTRRTGVRADLRAANVLEPLALGAPFDLVLDIGCFHNFDEADRARYAGNLARWTHPGSTYLVYAFFPGTAGPRRFGVTPRAMEQTFAPPCKLVSSTVDPNNAEQDSAWYRFQRIENE